MCFPFRLLQAGDTGEDKMASSSGRSLGPQPLLRCSDARPPLGCPEPLPPPVLVGPLLARAHWLRVAASRGQRPPSHGLSCPFPAAPLRAKQPASGGTGHHLWASLGLSSLLFPPRGVPDPCARRKQGPLVQAWAK